MNSILTDRRDARLSEGVSMAVPHPVRPTIEPDDSSHSLADVQRRQQAVCSQTTDEPDDGYKTDIATDVVAPYCCLVQTDVFRSPDCPSIVDRTEAPFSFSGCPFCIFVDSSEPGLPYVLQLVTEISIRFLNC